MEPELS